MANLIHTLPKVEFFTSILLQLRHADISHSKFQQFWITVYDVGLEENFQFMTLSMLEFVFGLHRQKKYLNG